MAKRISMQDVAERAGCSKNSVSQALRNSPRIGLATRKRIQELAKEMGYCPNPLVSALMAQNASRVNKGSAGNVIGFLTHWPEEPDSDRHHPNMIRCLEGMHRRAKELGYVVEEFPTWGGKYTPRRLHQVFMTRRINGLVLATAAGYEEFRKLPIEHYIAAGVATELSVYHLTCAATSDHGNMWVAMRKLHSLGYRRPGLVIKGVPFLRSSYQHNSVYEGAVAGILKRSALPIHLCDESNGLTSLRQWVEANRPDVVLGEIGVLQMLREIGLSIPGDMGFATFDRLPCHDGIAGFDSRFDLVGEAAIDLITSRLYRNEYGPPKHARTVVIHSEWADGASLPRRTTGPAAKAPKRQPKRAPRKRTRPLQG